MKKAFLHIWAGILMLVVLLVGCAAPPTPTVPITPPGKSFRYTHELLTMPPECKAKNDIRLLSHNKRYWIFVMNFDVQPTSNQVLGCVITFHHPQPLTERGPISKLQTEFPNDLLGSFVFTSIPCQINGPISITKDDYQARNDNGLASFTGGYIDCSVNLKAIVNEADEYRHYTASTLPSNNKVAQKAAASGQNRTVLSDTMTYSSTSILAKGVITRTGQILINEHPFSNAVVYYHPDKQTFLGEGMGMFLPPYTARSLPVTSTTYWTVRSVFGKYVNPTNDPEFWCKPYETRRPETLFPRAESIENNVLEWHANWVALLGNSRKKLGHYSGILNFDYSSIKNDIQPDKSLPSQREPIGPGTLRQGLLTECDPFEYNLRTDGGNIYIGASPINSQGNVVGVGLSNSRFYGKLDEVIIDPEAGSSDGPGG